MTKTVKLQVRVPVETWAALRARAKLEGLPVGVIVTKALNNYFKQLVVEFPDADRN